MSSVCLLLSLLFQTMSVGFGKQAAVTIESIGLNTLVTNIYYVISIGCLGFQAIAWQIALANYTLSYAYLFMSAIYVNILVMSFFIYDESITIFNVLGTILIITGIIIMTRSNDN